MDDADWVLTINTLACLAAGVACVIAESQFWLLCAWLAFFCTCLIEEPDDA